MAEIRDKKKKRNSKGTVFFRTLKYFFKYKYSVALLMFVYLLFSAISVIWPYVNGKVLFDHILEKDDVFLERFGMSGKYTLALLLVAFVLIGSRLISELCRSIQGMMMAKIATATVRDIKTDVFDAMSRLSLNFYTSKQTGGLMTRVLNDSTRVADFFIDGLPSMFVQGLTIIITFVVMYRLNWEMALIACILLPLLVFMTVKLRPGLWSLSTKRHRAERSVSGSEVQNRNPV